MTELLTVVRKEPEYIYFTKIAVDDVVFRYHIPSGTVYDNLGRGFTKKHAAGDFELASILRELETIGGKTVANRQKISLQQLLQA